jgi:hypothetical protein
VHLGGFHHPGSDLLTRLKIARLRILEYRLKPLEISGHLQTFSSGFEPI